MAQIIRFERVTLKDKYYITFTSNGVKKYLCMSANHRVGIVGTSTAPDVNNHNAIYDITMDNAEWDWDADRKTINVYKPGVKAWFFLIREQVETRHNCEWRFLDQIE